MFPLELHYIFILFHPSYSLCVRLSGVRPGCGLSRFRGFRGRHRASFKLLEHTNCGQSCKMFQDFRMFHGFRCASSTASRAAHDLFYCCLLLSFLERSSCTKMLILVCVLHASSYPSLFWPHRRVTRQVLLSDYPYSTSSSFNPEGLP